MGKIIGLVPRATLFEDNIPHHDIFFFVNPYVQQIVKQGATPLGLLPADGYASEDALALCDAFLLAGCNKIWPYHLQVIEHALAKHKPVLGICLGMQSIAAYFHVLDRAEALGMDRPVNIISLFEEMKKERFMFTWPIEHHYLENVTRESAEKSRHSINVKTGTRLYEILGTTEAEAVSLHSYQIAPVASRLQISAVADDGSIEGIEYGRFIVGVQFHPEVDCLWDKLFAAFVHDEWAA